MRLDFWNNPLVITAFRVKNRRGGLFIGLTLYMCLLAVACVAAWYLIPMHQARAAPQVSDAAKLHLIFCGLFAGQTILSAAVALGMTASAMNVEVTNNTLDYQRLTRLSPAEVLWGKLLGPPTTAYLMAISSVPFTFGLWALGATAISLGSLLLLYLQMASTVLLGGALGLLKPLQSAQVQKPPESEVSGVGCLFIIFLLLPSLGSLTMLPMLMGQRELASLAGLFVPLGPFVGLFQQHDPWLYTFRFFGIGIPLLLITPVAQLVAGTLCFTIMTRRLTNTVLPTFRKPLAYVLSAVVDILAAAVLLDPGPAFLGLGPPTRYYWACHLVIAFFLFASITPDRELLRSWIWRFRGRVGRARDLLLEDRSENILVLLTFCGIGLALYMLLVVAPMVAISGWDTLLPFDEPVLHPPIIACLLILSLGTIMLRSLFIIGKGGGWMLLLPLILDVILFAVGKRYQVDWLQAGSVISHWWSWHSGAPALSLVPFVGLHGTLFAYNLLKLHLDLRRETKEVERKLLAMGVGTQPAADADLVHTKQTEWIEP